MHDPSCACFSCKIHSIQWSPSCTPSRRNQIAPAQPMNSWERGIVKDSRGMPICLPGTADPMPIKHYVEHKHEIEAERRRMLTDPNYGKVPV